LSSVTSERLPEFIFCNIASNIYYDSFLTISDYTATPQPSKSNNINRLKLFGCHPIAGICSILLRLHGDDKVLKLFSKQGKSCMTNSSLFTTCTSPQIMEFWPALLDKIPPFKNGKLEFSDGKKSKRLNMPCTCQFKPIIVFNRFFSTHFKLFWANIFWNSLKHSDLLAEPGETRRNFN